MEELFTMKSDTIMNIPKKRNNTQIISTLRSDTDSEYLEKQKNTTQTNTNNDISNTNIDTTNKNFISSTINSKAASNSSTNLGTNNTTTFNSAQMNGNINLENLQEDIVSIAESLHNLVKMVDEQREKYDEQREKIMNIEKDLSRVNKIEGDIKQLNDNLNNISELRKRDKSPLLFSSSNKTDGYSTSSVENKSYSLDNKTQSVEKKTTIEVNPRSNEIKRELTINKSTSENDKKKSNLNNNFNGTKNNYINNNFINNRTLFNKNKPEVKRTSMHSDCPSDSCQEYSCTYDNSKEVDQKLNNVTKGINDELVNVKKVYASLLSSYAKSLKK